MTTGDSASVQSDSGSTDLETDPSSENGDDRDGDDVNADSGETDAASVNAEDNGGSEDDADGDSVDEYMITDPMQPQIDGSNREWLITASDFPEELHPTIERLNLAKIQYREQGHLPDSFSNKA